MLNTRLSTHFLKSQTCCLYPNNKHMRNSYQNTSNELFKNVMQHYTHLITRKASVQLMYITQDDEEKKENFLKNKMEGRKQKRRVM